jgi:protein-S-isoprenylcysteine O-methyltransferase Ste14
MKNDLWWPDDAGPRPVRPPRRRGVPDEVRRASVRAMLTFSFTVLSLMVTVFASLTHAWFFIPALAVTAVCVLGTVWGLVDIWIARQIAAQRYWGSGTDTAWAHAAAAPPRQRRAA